MHRQIVLDTETTGISAKAGHRIIEIGCLELVDRSLSGRDFHVYLNPERAVDAGALKVHGLSDEFLQDKALFSEHAQQLWEFLFGAELLIHNASFDIGFLDMEFARVKQPDGSSYPQLSSVCMVTDTLAMARKIHPGQANSLDALCKRYNVDASKRGFHGALLDSDLLCRVYLQMTGGQISLLSNKNDTDVKKQQANAGEVLSDGSAVYVVQATAEELKAHNEFSAQTAE